MDVRDHNAWKITELLPNCQERVKLWEDEAFYIGLPFRISEAYRTQQRQNQLWEKGRKNGVIVNRSEVVTYTKNSMHTKRIALDVYPIGVDSQKEVKDVLNRLERLGAHYGIYRPPETKAFGDFVHFQVYDIPLPKNNQYYQSSQLRRRDRMMRATSP